MTEFEQAIVDYLEHSRAFIPEGERRLVGKFTHEGAEYTYRLTTRDGSVDTDELRIVRRSK